MMSALTFTNPETLFTPPGYSHVVEAVGGRAIYVAGQVAIDRSGAIVGVGDVEIQARQAFENVGLALAAVGADFRHVVKLVTFVTDVASARAAFRAARDAYITTTAPASTLVEVRRLFRDELLIEVEAVAYL
jgi:enamine deaminase RidA (YjgF/YER057c/UK114 family)